MGDSQGNMPTQPEDLLAAPTPGEGEEEDDMTSVMSSDQRKALQHAAAKEAEALERETARPAKGEEPVPEVSIPKAAAVPSIGRAAAEEDGPVSQTLVRPKSSPAPAKTKDAAAASEAAWSNFELAAFILLAVAVAVALRM